jgi:hypothetical protein
MPAWSHLDAGEIRLQAARILDSDDLRRATKLRALLTFFVEERIAYGDRPISQSRLAEAVLDKGEGFSGTTNAHVRIYLRRLRQRMAAYYAGPGAADTIVLGVTNGPYRLSAELRAGADGAAGHDGDGVNGAVKKAARRHARPAAIVLTSELSGSGVDGSLGLLPVLVPRALGPHMVGHDGLVAIGPVPRHLLSEPPCASPAVRASAAEYLLEGTLAVGPQQADGRRPLEIVVRMHEIDSGKHVWSRTCTETVASEDAVTIAEQLAARLAAAILAAQA